MFEILSITASFFAIIALGAFTKYIGLFDEKSSQIFSNFALRVNESYLKAKRFLVIFYFLLMQNTVHQTTKLHENYHIILHLKMTRAFQSK